MDIPAGMAGSDLGKLKGFGSNDAKWVTHEEMVERIARLERMVFRMVVGLNKVNPEFIADLIHLEADLSDDACSETSSDSLPTT